MTVVVVVVTWWLPRCVIGHQCLQDLRRVNRAVNIRDTAETKEDQVLRRVRFVDLRRTAGLLRRLSCNTRPSPSILYDPVIRNYTHTRHSQ